MLIILHVFIALASIAWSSFVFFAPSLKRLNISYGLIAGTLASGTYLVIATHSPLLQSCIAGLVYLSIVSAETFATRTRLATQKTE